MPDVSKLNLDGTTYKIKDDDARKYLVVVNNTSQDATKVNITTSDNQIELALQSDLNAVNNSLNTRISNEASARAASDTNLSNCINALQAAIGSPLVAATASAMTDHSKIYVYTGSESGYTAGHWYYWNGSAWTDGGVYNSTALETDKTLTVPNMAADAEVVGRVVKVQTLQTDYNATISGRIVANNIRWFLNGFAYGKINKVAINCGPTGSANVPLVIEGWAVSGSTFTRVFQRSVTTYAAYAYNVFDINYDAGSNPIMVSVYSTASNIPIRHTLDTSLGYSAYRTNDLTSTTLTLTDANKFQGLCLNAYIDYTVSYAKSVNPAQIKTVSPNGTCNYTSIAAAVNAAVDGDVILVYPGIYTDPIEAWGKEISIIGVDNKSCIITNDTGNYDTPAVEIDSGRIAGFTIIATGANPTTTPEDNKKYMMDYCIHADNYHAMGRTLIIEDCILRNNHRTCFGIGLYDHNTVIIRNCDAWSAAPPNDILNPLWNKRGVLYFHNRQPSEFFSNVTGQKIRVINNSLYCDDIIALQIYDTCTNVDMDTAGYINECEAEFINNMICAKYPNSNYKTTSNGVTEPTEFAVDSVIGGTGFTDHLKLSAISYGNNLSYLNA